MSIIESGQTPIAARARLMSLLGEQLITDEVSAVSELLKNAYDADAPEVLLILNNVSNPEQGYVTVKDFGHGMTKAKVLSSWLELGTLSKARDKDHKPRRSESGKRICLGEKGLGRLAVHKLGLMTELVTKRKNENVETRLIVDWTAFERNEAFLQDVPIKWEVTEPRVFTDSECPQGTQITIRKLHRPWTKDIIERVYRNAKALTSPFVDLEGFKVDVKIKDKLFTEISLPKITDIVKMATYRLEGEFDPEGFFSYDYFFIRPDIAGLKREKGEEKKDVRDPDHFSGQKKPSCGSFKVKFYAWDLRTEDIKAVFENTSTYREIIRPNSGIKVFRDGFRVFPYGNINNDWLSMDSARVTQFELHLSRNQIIGAIEISSESNPFLLDKTDREGLIDNEQFKDFISLLKTSLALFEAERFIDRRKLKEVTGRLQKESAYRATFSQNFVALSRMIAQNPKIDGQTRVDAQRLISEAKDAFDKILFKNERPLLVAAAIGLTLMMPTHEIQRNLHEALKMLREIKESKGEISNKIDQVIPVLKQADEVVVGISNLMKQPPQEEIARLEKVAESALKLLKYKFDRNKIKTEIIAPKPLKVKGSEKLLTIALINFLDNSIYWLQKNPENDRKIKIIITSVEDDDLLVVSDNGPGFEDLIEIVTLPFFTRKPGGMGLGFTLQTELQE